MLLAAIEASVRVNRLEAVGRLDEFLESNDDEIAEAAQEALHMAGGMACEPGDEDDEEDLR